MVSCWKMGFENRPLLMGILNLTLDSFSDGGQFFSQLNEDLLPQYEEVLQTALLMKEQGATLWDIGGESTAPGSLPVAPSQQIARVIPAIKRLAEQGLHPLSVDTTSARVAEQALQAGASIVNDISGATFDDQMPEVIRRYQAGVCIGHIQGRPQSMQESPQYDDVVEEVFLSLKQRCEILVSQGIDQRQIAIDPGIGFGKTFTHNWELLRHIDRFFDLKCPIMIGHSRKAFLRDCLQNVPSDDPRVLADYLALLLEVPPLTEKRLIALVNASLLTTTNKGRFSKPILQVPYFTEDAGGTPAFPVGFKNRPKNDPLYQRHRLDLLTGMVSAYLADKRVNILRVHYIPCSQAGLLKE